MHGLCSGDLLALGPYCRCRLEGHMWLCLNVPTMLAGELSGDTNLSYQPRFDRVRPATETAQ
jgi:hypothetical protein